MGPLLQSFTSTAQHLFSLSIPCAIAQKHRYTTCTDGVEEGLRRGINATHDLKQFRAQKITHLLFIMMHTHTHTEAYIHFSLNENFEGRDWCGVSENVQNTNWLSVNGTWCENAGGELAPRKGEIKKRQKQKQTAQVIFNLHLSLCECVFILWPSAFVFACVSLILTCAFYSPLHRSVSPPLVSFFFFHFPPFPRRTTHPIHRDRYTAHTHKGIRVCARTHGNRHAYTHMRNLGS